MAKVIPLHIDTKKKKINTYTLDNKYCTETVNSQYLLVYLYTEE